MFKRFVCLFMVIFIVSSYAVMAMDKPEQAPVPMTANAVVESKTNERPEDKKTFMCLVCRETKNNDAVEIWPCGHQTVCQVCFVNLVRAKKNDFNLNLCCLNQDCKIPYFSHNTPSAISGEVKHALTKGDRIWLAKYTRPCPECGTNIEKTEGCNHMTCKMHEPWHHFCWVCLEDYPHALPNGAPGACPDVAPGVDLLAGIRAAAARAFEIPDEIPGAPFNMRIDLRYSTYRQVGEMLQNQRVRTDQQVFNHRAIPMSEAATSAIINDELNNFSDAVVNRIYPGFFRRVRNTITHWIPNGVLIRNKGKIIMGLLVLATSYYVNLNAK